MTERDQSFEANFRLNCDPNLLESLTQAKELAAGLGHATFEPEHLLAALMDNSEASAAIRACKADPQALKSALMKYLMESSDLISGDPEAKLAWGDHSIDICRRASIYRATVRLDALVSGATILIGFTGMNTTFAGNVLDKYEIDRFDLVNWITHRIAKGENPVAREAVPAFAGNESKPHSGGQKSALQEFATNLNDLARKGKIDHLVGRGHEIEQAVGILSCRRKSNPVFIGDPGVGKTALAEGLAARIVSGDVPVGLRNCVIHSLDIPGMVAGARYRGDFEERLKMVMKEAEADPNVILFVDEIHTLLGAGSSSGSMDAANILKPKLANGDIRCMGATTVKEYRSIFENDAAMARRFQKVTVGEPNRDEAVNILQGLSGLYADHHKVAYDAAALEAAVDLSIRYLPSRKLPDKAIDIIDLAGAVHSSVAVEEAADRPSVSVADICATVSRLAKVPVNSADVDRAHDVLKLQETLPMAVFHQDEAINSLIRGAKLACSNLSEEDRPLGSYLFTGPSGVGKTELAKQLAKGLHLKLLRFDMSEYMEKHSVARLIGAPPGYVGYDKGGLLTEAVDEYPHAVVLLDEIEKAHPDVMNLFLQVLDDGCLTDGNGRSIDFRNVFIIASTNAGGEVMSRPSPGFRSQDNGAEMAEEGLKAAFSQPIRGRFDEIIRFNPLSEAAVELVVDKKVYELEASLQKMNLTITLSAAARSWLARKGFSKELGARPVGKAVRDHVRLPLADEILSGSLKGGGQVLVDVKDDGAALSFDFRPLDVPALITAE
jgi:ATP-dependent Clp protease ATP-binding subunit ClpA